MKQEATAADLRSALESEQNFNWRLARKLHQEQQQVKATQKALRSSTSVIEKLQLRIQQAEQSSSAIGEFKNGRITHL